MKIWVLILILLVIAGALFVVISATTQSPDFIKSGVSAASLATAGILNNQGMHQESIGFGVRAIELDPGNYDAVKELARAYVGMDDYGNAVAVYDDYIQYMNGNVENGVWKDKALIHKAAGEDEEAAECYNAVIESCNYQLTHSPGDISLLRELGAIQINIGSYGDALDTYEKLIANSPDDALAWLEKGDAYLMMSAGEEEDLGTMYRSLISGETYSGGTVHGTTVFSSYQKAHEAYMKAIELDPRLYAAVVSRIMVHYENSVGIYSEIVNI